MFQSVYIYGLGMMGGSLSKAIKTKKISKKVYAYDINKSSLLYAKKNKINFLAIEYSGHGKSSGEFTKGNITIWTNDTKLVIKKLVKKNERSY